MSERNFFKVVAWYHWWFVPAFTLTGILAFRREIVPYDSLSVFGTFFHYLAYSQPLLLKIGFIAVAAAHVLEACYAYVLSRRLKLTTKDTVLWTMQTFVMGFHSLLILKAKSRKEEKKEE